MLCLSGKTPSGKVVHNTVELALLTSTGWQKHHLTLTGDVKHCQVTFVLCCINNS
jgi:hypothetical protein